MPALARSRPSAEGVAARGVLDLLDAAAREDVELHSLMVLRHGRVVAEGWWAPYAAETPHLLHSISKSLTCVAVGLAVDEGLLNVADPLVSHLGDLAPSDVDERVRSITVDHALRMATGHVEDPVGEVIARSARDGDPDWLHAFFALPPEREPGTVFAYNQLATYAVARIVQRATGRRLVDYLGERVFEPLGVAERHWLRDALGHDWGFSGVHLTTESLAAFGQLCLQDGVWRGRRLVPAGWLGTATALLMPNDAAHRGDPAEPVEPDWSLGYGYQFWRSRHGFRADGAYGQLCLVLPERDAVVVTTACTERMQLLLDLVWRHLLPAFGDGTGPAADHDDRLAERMASLALPIPRSTDSTAGPAGAFGPGLDARLRAVSAVRLLPTADDRTREHTLELTLDEATPETTPEVCRVVVGDGRWVAGEWPATPPVPLRSAGGWVGGRFVAQLRLIQTPHLLRLVLDPATGTFDCGWREPVLHGSDPAAYGG